MLLTSRNFKEIAYASVQWAGMIGFDFETTGLNPYAGDKAIIVGFTDPQGSTYSWYFEDEGLHALRELFTHPSLKYCAHNAKFELSFLREQFDIEIRGTVYDTEVLARVENNNHMSYSLQSCAERVGLTKTPAMLAWLKERGNKGRHVHAEPKLLEEYVEQDAWLSWELARLQIETFKHWDTTPCPIKPVVDLECRVLRPLFEMECRGLLVDIDYCKRAIEYEKERIASAKERFKTASGVAFVDSRKTLQPVFDSAGISYGATALGNASFTEDNLIGGKDHGLVRALLDHRNASKRLSAYWENFLELQVAGVIHPSINQNRAQTGRMSISDPSCQNWPVDSDDTEFPVRRAFIARPGNKIVSCDWAQIEFRLMCDEAGDMKTIRAIQEGLDVHQEVADMAGVPRSLAKNGRFAKLYGSGVPNLAKTLGVSLHVAQTISDSIDKSSPRINQYCRELIRHAQSGRMGFDFLGRRFFFDQGFEYKAPNFRIQGAAAEILKTAICELSIFLKKKAHPTTAMIIVVHDEVIFDMHPSDLRLLPEIKRIMIDAHTHKKHLSLDVSIAVGDNMHDLEDYKC